MQSGLRRLGKLLTPMVLRDGEWEHECRHCWEVGTWEDCCTLVLHCEGQFYMWGWGLWCWCQCTLETILEPKFLVGKIMLSASSFSRWSTHSNTPSTRNTLVKPGSVWYTHPLVSWVHPTLSMKVDIAKNCSFSTKMGRRMCSIVHTKRT